MLSGEWGPERTQLRSPELLAALDVDFILGEPALALDVAERTVHTANRSLTADNIVIATGTMPRRLAGQPELAGVHVLRTVDDALALRADLLSAKRFVVVGEGVLGAEIAATARGLGLDVTMTGPQRAPMTTQLGDFAADLLARLHIASGVHLRLGVGVAGFTEQAGRVAGVRLATGEVLPADAVVLAIGSTPTTGWLAGSSLTLADGVVCDSNCCAAEGIYAAGDIARWDHVTTATSMRLENRTTPPSRLPLSHRPSLALAGHTSRSPTSGPTSTEQRFRSTAPSRPTPRVRSWTAISGSDGSSPATSATAS